MLYEKYEFLTPMLMKIQAFRHVAEDPEDRGFYIFMLK